MANVLTVQFLDSLKPKSGLRLEHTDAKCAGLVIRVTDNGTKSFCFKYRSRVDGAVKRITLGRYPDLSLAAARTAADSHRKSIIQGTDPATEKQQAKTATRKAAGILFDHVAERYIDEYAKPNKSSWKADEGFLKRPRAAWGKRPAASITDDDAAELLSDIAKKSPVSANRTQSVLHKLFIWAKEPGRKFVAINPLADMPRQKKEKPRDRVLNDDEIKKLWAGLENPAMNLEPAFALALKMILCTMARPGEVSEAEIHEFINLKSKEPEWHLIAEKVKNRRAFIYPLSSLAVSVVRQAIKKDDQIVLFPSKWSVRANIGIARNSLSQAVQETVIPFLGIAHFTPHDLRRTAATISRRAGAPRDSVDALLNHTKTDVTATYDRYDMLAEKRQVSEILEREIKKIIGTKRRAASSAT